MVGKMSDNFEIESQEGDEKKRKEDANGIERCDQADILSFQLSQFSHLPTCPPNQHRRTCNKAEFRILMERIMLSVPGGT
jgi:hypothetical protein